ILFLILGAIFIFSYFSQEASKMDMRGNLSASIGQKVIVENNVKECYFKLNDDELKKRLCLYEIDGGIFLPTTFEVNNFEIEEKYSVRGILKESTNNEIYLDGISYEKMD
ncbi:MAG: hypothetical protein KKB62_02390, partial [Nanoarchaeota archaeon]|nr:hypothetical protein [Nanoarchaeota archaeon]